MSNEIQIPDNPLKKTMRKLKVPKPITMRWARTIRYFVAKKYRPIFDVESNPKWVKRKIEEKVVLANKLRAKMGDFPDEITIQEYRDFLDWMEVHPNVKRARAMMLLNNFQDDRIINHIFKVEEKALKHGDPNKLINLNRYIDSYNRSMAELLQLVGKQTRKKSKKDNIIEIDAEEKKAIEIKYADGMNNEND